MEDSWEITYSLLNNVITIELEWRWRSLQLFETVINPLSW